MNASLPRRSFYYIRHGESEWNVLGRFAGGNVDTPLTERGRCQAENIRPLFKILSPSPTHIIHSPLSRAADTAKILNHKRRYPMIEEYDLREIMAGDWEGIPYMDARQRWADGQSPPNGENLDMLAKRMKGIFTKILSNPNYEMPFIAAHGRLLNGLDHLFGIAPRSLQIENCQLLKFAPTENISKHYPFDVYSLSMEEGHIHEEPAPWSQI